MNQRKKDLTKSCQKEYNIDINSQNTTFYSVENKIFGSFPLNIFVFLTMRYLYTQRKRREKKFPIGFLYDGFAETKYSAEVRTVFFI